MMVVAATARYRTCWNVFQGIERMLLGGHDLESQKVKEWDTY